MHIVPSTLVKPHLTTSNVYVRRSIILANIKAITNFQNSTPRENVSFFLWFELVKIKKKQRSFLADINIRISEIEQQAFNFGSNFLDQ